ncbi:hypothetical protein [Mycobacterium terramassiliense]|uniref:hypothetical protein n=1 Tax=Mycobacterium terramassiliense TaxID=1841859 RepID=UPI0012FF8021|nr:hypothetical protein [Mycobacterium terramassiliense]
MPIPARASTARALDPDRRPKKTVVETLIHLASKHFEATAMQQNDFLPSQERIPRREIAETQRYCSFTFRLPSELDRRLVAAHTPTNARITDSQ